ARRPAPARAVAAAEAQGCGARTGAGGQRGEFVLAAGRQGAASRARRHRGADRGLRHLLRPPHPLVLTRSRGYRVAHPGYTLRRGDACVALLSASTLPKKGEAMPRPYEEKKKGPSVGAGFNPAPYTP